MVAAIEHVHECKFFLSDHSGRRGVSLTSSTSHSSLHVTSPLCLLFLCLRFLLLSDVLSVF